MKKIKNEKTGITESKVKFQGNDNYNLDYKDLIELALDIVPQGGFTPRDIKNRTRIQDALDKSVGNEIELEDSDYANLEKIIEQSRWVVRNKDINKFLSIFIKN